MAEQMCYEELLPRQPSEGALDWCIQTKFKTGYAIYGDPCGIGASVPEST